jgi:hypothetical protein
MAKILVVATLLTISIAPLARAREITIRVRLGGVTPARGWMVIVKQVEKRGDQDVEIDHRLTNNQGIVRTSRIPDELNRVRIQCKYESDTYSTSFEDIYPVQDLITIDLYKISAHVLGQPEEAYCCICVPTPCGCCCYRVRRSQFWANCNAGEPPAPEGPYVRPTWDTGRTREPATLGMADSTVSGLGGPFPQRLRPGVDFPVATPDKWMIGEEVGLLLRYGSLPDSIEASKGSGTLQARRDRR